MVNPKGGRLWPKLAPQLLKHFECGGDNGEALAHNVLNLQATASAAELQNSMNRWINENTQNKN